MQLVNGTQFLNINFSLELFRAAPVPAVLLTVMFALTRIYASLKSHRLDLSITVLQILALQYLDNIYVLYHHLFQSNFLF